MSRYSINIADALTKALSGVPSAQPEGVAGYWANRDFFHAEFMHFVAVAKGYEDRRRTMKTAYDDFANKSGGAKNLDHFGNSRGNIVATTDRSWRREKASEIRKALKRLAERALELGITNDSNYDEFVRSLRIDM